MPLVTATVVSEVAKGTLIAPNNISNFYFNVGGLFLDYEYSQFYDGSTLNENLSW